MKALIIYYESLDNFYYERPAKDLDQISYESVDNLLLKASIIYYYESVDNLLWKPSIIYYYESVDNLLLWKR
jgi:hypothetical protein